MGSRLSVMSDGQLRLLVQNQTWYCTSLVFLLLKMFSTFLLIFLFKCITCWHHRYLFDSFLHMDNCFLLLTFWRLVNNWQQLLYHLNLDVSSNFQTALLSKNTDYSTSIGEVFVIQYSKTNQLWYIPPLNGSPVKYFTPCMDVKECQVICYLQSVANNGTSANDSGLQRNPRYHLGTILDELVVAMAMKVNQMNGPMCSQILGTHLSHWR